MGIRDHIRCVRWWDIHLPRRFLLLLQELPRRISTDEEREILSLLCKVHELEIEKVEMQSEAVLKEHEVKRRDLLILKYDKQRTLCDEIIQRQRKLIEGESEPKIYTYSRVAKAILNIIAMDTNKHQAEGNWRLPE